MYRYISNTPGSVSFALTTNVMSTLTHSNKTTRVGTKQSGVNILTNEYVMYTPSRSLPEGCTDRCGALDTARTIRVKIIGPIVDKAAVLADWEEIKRLVDKSISDYQALDGFLEPISADFSV